MAHLVLVTGLPGSGKSTFAKRAYPTYEHLETDALFYVDGVYTFEPSKLVEYHNQTQKRTQELLGQGKNVVVANTFSRVWEMHPYTQMSFDSLTVYYMEPPGTFDELARRNVHGVPVTAIIKMSARWEHKLGEYRVR